MTSTGAVGGNAAGAVLKDKSLGTLGNNIAGILGGGLGGTLLSALGLLGGGGGDAGGVIGDIASGSVGGGVLLAIVGVVRSAMAKNCERARQSPRRRGICA